MPALPFFRELSMEANRRCWACGLLIDDAQRGVGVHVFPAPVRDAFRRSPAMQRGVVNTYVNLCAKCRTALPTQRWSPYELLRALDRQVWDDAAPATEAPPPINERNARLRLLWMTAAVALAIRKGDG